MSALQQKAFPLQKKLTCANDPSRFLEDGLVAPVWMQKKCKIECSYAVHRKKDTAKVNYVY